MLNEKCNPFIDQAKQLFPMTSETNQLIARKVNLSRKFEAYVLALDKPSEPYMSWLCNELEKKSTDVVKFRAKGVKCFETPLAAEEPYSRSLFEEGALMVIRVNSMNEQKRSVTVRLGVTRGLVSLSKNKKVKVEVVIRSGPFPASCFSLVF